MRDPQEGKIKVSQGSKDVLSPLGTGAQSEERTPQVVCYSVGHETGGWMWRRERRVEI